MAKNEERDRPATDTEIEVTEEMAEAGADVLLEADLRFDDYRDVASDIFTAMLRKASQDARPCRSASQNFPQSKDL